MDPLLKATNEESRGVVRQPGAGPQPDHRPTAGRRSFLRRGAAAAAAAMAAFAGREAHANPNYLPSLYPGENVLEFQTIQADENTHVQFLVNALGANARPMPTFQNLDMATLQQFAQTSMALENTGVGAYLGAAPYISTPAYLVAAAQIMDIEARHAGYLNVLLNSKMTRNVLGQSPSFETPLTQQQVVNLAGPFIASLNGGPPLSFSTTNLSPANDIAILNFALALEYLESTFYNMNVPKFT